MSTTDLSPLDLLASTSPFFDGMGIMRRILDRCLWIIESTEREVAVQDVGMPLISKEISQLGVNALLMLVRSGPIRNLVEGLWNIRQRGEGDTRNTALAVYSRLAEVVTGLCRYRSSTGTIDWTSAGFDRPLLIVLPPELGLAVWTGRPPDDAVLWPESAEVERMVYDGFTQADVGRLLLVGMSADRGRAVGRALELLGSVGSSLFRDVLLNIRHICIVESTDGGRTPHSFSLNVLPGCCFLSGLPFENDRVLMEQIYHEALHWKLFNLMCLEELFPALPTSDDPALFTCPWKPRGGSADGIWRRDRVFAAWHVYVHLLTVYDAVLTSGSAGEDHDAMTDRRRTAVRKGAILRDWLNGHEDTVLTPAGRTFHHQLCDIYLRVS